MTHECTYVSVWDDSIEIKSKCLFDDETNIVSDVETVDVDGMDIEILTDKYIILPNGEEFRDFKNEEIDDILSDEDIDFLCK